VTSKFRGEIGDFEIVIAENKKPGNFNITRFLDIKV
jgi:hypothetical protein